MTDSKLLDVILFLQFLSLVMTTVTACAVGTVLDHVDQKK